MGSPATVHRKIFEHLVDREGVDVTVRYPQEPDATVSNSANKVLGTKAVVSEVGVEQQVKVLWSTDYFLTESHYAQDIPGSIAALGKLDRVDVILRCKLADVLDDATDAQDRTWFDKAKDIVRDNYRYSVVGTRRTGLPNKNGPYILWAALKQEGRV